MKANIANSFHIEVKTTPEKWRQTAEIDSYHRLSAKLVSVYDTNFLFGIDDTSIIKLVFYLLQKEDKESQNGHCRTVTQIRVSADAVSISSYSVSSYRWLWWQVYRQESNREG